MSRGEPDELIRDARELYDAHHHGDTVFGDIIELLARIAESLEQSQVRVTELENEAEGLRTSHGETEKELGVAKSNLDLVGNFRDQMAAEIVDLRMLVLELKEQITELTEARE